MATAEMTTNQPVLAGVIGFYDSPAALIAATTQVRDARYQYFDTFTPFPVHGLEAAQGLKRSPIPYVTFIAGLSGGSLGFLFQYWTSAIDWPINVGGKPFNSWPAFIPITFELTILFAALSTVAAMFLFNGLPNIRRKAFDPGLTRDRFAILIEAPLPVEADDVAAIQKSARFKPFDLAEATEFLRRNGATEVRTVHTEGWF